MDLYNPFVNGRLACKGIFTLLTVMGNGSIMVPIMMIMYATFMAKCTNHHFLIFYIKTKYSTAAVIKKFTPLVSEIT